MNDDGAPGMPSQSPPEYLAGSPGAILRRCREFHGLSLEEASETTKIGIYHLKALEDDQIRLFANQAYLKGFLRIYATYLGLNSDDIARLYDKLFGVQGDNSDTTKASIAPPRPPRPLISLKKLIFPALLLAIILVTAPFFKSPPPPVRQAQPVVAAVPLAPAVQNATIQAVQSSGQKRTSEPAIPAVKAKIRPPAPLEPEVVAIKRPVETAKGFILKLKVTQNGTLTASVDGSTSQQLDLTSGDVIEWKAEKKVSLELSNAGSVDVEINGKPYKSLGPPGKPVYIELDADGIRQ
jgi:cytoskeletal protein RodZ